MATVSVNEDSIIIEVSVSGDSITISATGGPEDPVMFDCSSAMIFELDRDNIETIQSSFLKFMNTGFFNHSFSESLSESSEK